MSQLKNAERLPPLLRSKVQWFIARSRRLAQHLFTRLWLPAGWTAFLKLRETLLVALEELLRRVSPSEIVVGVACSTTPEQPERISEFMRSVVSENVQLAFETCRFLRSSASVMTLSLKSVHASSPRMIPRTACSASFAAFGRFSSRMPINRVNDAAHS